MLCMSINVATHQRVEIAKNSIKNVFEQVLSEASVLLAVQGLEDWFRLIRLAKNMMKFSWFARLH